VSVRIRPEPSDEQRAVLLRALAAVDGGREAPSVWWQTGIREAVEDEPDEKE
jgi:hypothetical protein